MKCHYTKQTIPSWVSSISHLVTVTRKVTNIAVGRPAPVPASLRDGVPVYEERMSPQGPCGGMERQGLWICRESSRTSLVFCSDIAVLGSTSPGDSPLGLGVNMVNWSKRVLMGGRHGPPGQHRASEHPGNFRHAGPLSPCYSAQRLISFSPVCTQ